MYLKKYTHTLLILGVGVILLLVFCVSIFFKIPSITPYLFILPHFIIAPEKLHSIRFDLRKDIISPDPLIIIISPDHFSSYTSNDLIYDTTVTTLCIQGSCHQSAGAFIDEKRISYLKQGTTLILPDHGIGAHLEFIKKYFPTSSIIPLLVQPRNQEGIDKLIHHITNLSKGKETIIIGSVDRSHYVPEPWAKLHDIHTWTILSEQSSDWHTWRNLDVDCPNCLYIVDTIAKKSQQSPHLLRRDSSAELFGTTGTDNTSRGVIRYHPKDTTVSLSSPLMTGITLMMVGDMIYTRGVKDRYPNPQKLSSALSQRYEQYDTNISPIHSFHRLGVGIDLLGLNLETPLTRIGETCFTLEKPYSFCSDSSFLPLLSSLGFNFFSLANNHRYDAGLGGYTTTKDILSENNINIVSDDQFLNTTLYGITLSLQSYDFTNTKKEQTLLTACENITIARNNNSRVIVSVHRGEEYTTQHNKEQEYLAQQLVGCGAEAIIGHHPHVIQDIQWIDDVPVFYSLGNFLMDQDFSKETQAGLIAGLIIPQTGKIEIMNGPIERKIIK